MQSFTSNFRFTHLQHDPFSYTITVNNKKGTIATGTVRIFIAPKTDEQGHAIPLVEQRRLMTEMDRFTATCKQTIEAPRQRPTIINI